MGRKWANIKEKKRQKIKQIVVSMQNLELKYM